MDECLKPLYRIFSIYALLFFTTTFIIQPNLWCNNGLAAVHITVLAIGKGGITNMNENKTDKMICKSIFKSGENTTSIQFTKKWIELINRLEKSKSAKF